MAVEAGGRGTCPLNKASQSFTAQLLRFSPGLLCEQHRLERQQLNNGVEQYKCSVSVSAAANGTRQRWQGEMVASASF